MYAVEACLLEGLPEIFRPDIVSGLGNETVTTIADESPESVAERDDLNKKLDVLKETTRTLQRWERFTGSGA